MLARQAGRPGLGRVDLRAADRIGRGFAVDALGHGLEPALGIDEEDPGEGDLFAGHEPVPDLDPAAERPARLDLARLENALAPLDEDRGAAARSQDRVGGDGQRGLQGEGQLDVGEHIGAQGEVRVGRLEADLERARRRVEYGQDPAGDGPEGPAYGRKPHFGLDAGLEIGRFVLEDVGQDPDPAQVGDAEKLVPAGEPLARRYVPGQDETRRGGDDANVLSGLSRLAELLDLAVVHAQAAQLVDLALERALVERALEQDVAPAELEPLSGLELFGGVQGKDEGLLGVEELGP